MQDKSEKLIKLIYRKHKSGHRASLSGHPDEETMACFMEDRLSAEEQAAIRQHLTECSYCGQAFLAQVQPDSASQPDVPQELIARVKNLVSQHKAGQMLEVLLKLKDDLLELLATNGDVLVGQELVPAPVLRSRQIKGFKDEVLILKDLGSIRVEIKVEKTGSYIFNVTVNVKDRKSLQVIKDLRVTLLKDSLELESYVNVAGKVIFEHIQLGKYTLEITDIKEKLAAILLDIRS